MDIFLIDFENVKSEGLNGILNLAKTDLVCVFWSLKEDKLKIETTEQLMKCQVPVYFYKADVGGKNALDHQLSSYLGYLIGKGSDAHYYIISNDKGYRFLADFWKRMKVDAPIELAPSIKAVKIRQQQKQQQQLFNEPRIERIAQKESPKLLPVKETPVEEEVPEVIPVDLPTEEAVMEQTPAETTEERPARKKRRGHRSRRRPKQTEETIQEVVQEIVQEENAEEDLSEAEVVLEIPEEGLVAEVTLEEQAEDTAAISEEVVLELLPAETEEELSDAEVLLEIPNEGILEVTLEEAPEEEPKEENVPEEKAPKRSRSRSSRNRRSRSKKTESPVAEVTDQTPVSQPEPAEEPAEVPAEPAVEPTTESVTETAPAETAEAPTEEAPAEAPAKKPAKRSRRRPSKKTQQEETTEVPVTETPAEVPREEPSPKLPEEKAPAREPISMETLTELLPDSKEEPWMPSLLGDINNSHNKKELYAKVIRRLKQEHGREIYHKIKKLVP